MQFLMHILPHWNQNVGEIHFVNNGVEECSESYLKYRYWCTYSATIVKLKKVMSQFVCICRTPWIEESTSRAVYGDKQNEFNSHICCKCDGWFHNFVFLLAVCSLQKGLGILFVQTANFLPQFPGNVKLS